MNSAEKEKKTYLGKKKNNPSNLKMIRDRIYRAMKTREIWGKG